jgi:hypothetical protein
VLLPAESLNDDDLFIDNMPLAEFASASGWRSRGGGALNSRSAFGTS